MIVSILLFLVIFTFLVSSHEFGHFIIARMNGIRVKEFFIGMGPVLWEKKKDDTSFSIRLLPFGGACVFDGETGFEEEDEKREYDEHSFQNVNVWGRIATLFAGPFFNFILGFLMALIVVSFSLWRMPVVTGLTPDSAAAEAGLSVGDTIISINGEKVHSGDEVSMLSRFSDGSPMEITYRKADEAETESHTAVVMPKYDDSYERYFLGVYVDKQERVTGKSVIPYAWYEVRYYFKATLKSLSMIVKGKVKLDDFSGPVGMVKVVDETVETTKPYGLPTVVLNLLELLILLSINVGVLNLLPIPALDGGRLVFQFIEVIAGKPVPREKEGIVHLAGAVVVIIFMIVVLFNDIGKFL